MGIRFAVMRAGFLDYRQMINSTSGVGYTDYQGWGLTRASIVGCQMNFWQSGAVTVFNINLPAQFTCPNLIRPQGGGIMTCIMPLIASKND